MKQVIKSVMIKNKQDGQQYHCDMVILTAKDWQQIATLQQIIIEQLSEPELFFPLTEKEIQEALGDNGIIVGAVVNHTLIGFSTILFPSLEKDNLGTDLGLTEEAAGKLGYLEASNVKAEFAGNSLQKKMRACVFEIAAKRERWEHVVSTVSPKNYASIVGSFSFGLFVVKLQPKYQDYWRYTFYQNRVTPLQVDKETAEIVPCADLNRQTSLLAQGYYGYEFLKEQQSVVFAKGI